jgi:peptidoglycan hydrolase CwlO-like protein
LVDTENKLKRYSEKYKTRAENLLQTIKNKDDEIFVLNDDRTKLQHALSDLEQRIIEISRNLENSVADCWKLSSELARCKDIQKDEAIKLTSYYKQQIARLEEELAFQSENFNKRIMKKVQESYEKSASFKVI